VESYITAGIGAGKIFRVESFNKYATKMHAEVDV
jgi:hypothetical protein